MENRTGYQVTSKMVRSVHELAGYTKIYMCNTDIQKTVISGKHLDPEVPGTTDFIVLPSLFIFTFPTHTVPTT
jgi:hypothetical protein